MYMIAFTTTCGPDHRGMQVHAFSADAPWLVRLDCFEYIVKPNDQGADLSRPVSTARAASRT